MQKKKKKKKREREREREKKNDPYLNTYTIAGHELILVFKQIEARFYFHIIILFVCVSVVFRVG